MEYGAPSAMTNMQIEDLAVRMKVGRVEDILYGSCSWLDGTAIWRPDS